MNLVITSGVFLVATKVFLTAVTCPVCFRVQESATTDGVQAAVWVLVAVTVVVLGAFGRFIAGFVRREREQCRR